MTEDDDEEFPGEIHPASKEEWLALTRRTPMTEAEKERAAVEEIDEEELLRRFRAMFRHDEDWGRMTAKSFAQEHGVPESCVSLTLSGKRRITDRIANALGYERCVVFRRSEHLKEGR